MSNERDQLYADAGKQFAPAIRRLARAVEADPDKARDLEQDIHCELWRSLARFDGRCALKTWVYRVAHNVAAEHVGRARRHPAAVPLTDVEHLSDGHQGERAADSAVELSRAYELIRTLPTLDAQVMLMWLEGESAAEIAGITGLSAGAVAVRTHRVRSLIGQTFHSSGDSK